MQNYKFYYTVLIIMCLDFNCLLTLNMLAHDQCPEAFSSVRGPVTPKAQKEFNLFWLTSIPQSFAPLY
jgi:hypothetical protein